MYYLKMIRLLSLNGDLKQWPFFGHGQKAGQNYTKEKSFIFFVFYIQGDEKHEKRNFKI